MVRFTLREPVRGASEGLSAGSGEPPPVMAVFRLLWSRRSFRYMTIGGSLHAFVGYGRGPVDSGHVHAQPRPGHGGKWASPYSIWDSPPSPAPCSAATWGTASAPGTNAGYLWLPGLAILASLPFSLYAYITSDPYAALWTLAVPAALGAYYLGPTFSMTQGLVGLRMRALASSILLFILNIIGLGLGPQFTGIASDLLNAWTDLGADSLRWALVLCLTFNLVSAAMYLAAGKTIRADLAANRELD